MHEIESLWERHHPPGKVYPPGVMAVPQPIPGRAFFPGGYGLWNAVSGCALPPLPVGGVMVLGHDFHSEEGYRKSLAAGEESLKIPTWRVLVKLLMEAELNLEQCFFTNLYMGLRIGTATTGPFPGATNPAFVAHCQTFLLDQLKTQRPALILTLGVQVPPVIGALSPELAPWASKKGLKHLDSVGSVRADVRFQGLPDYRTTFVALTHPSLRHASIRHRRYGGASGAEAEIRMLRDGVTVAKSTARDAIGDQVQL